MRDEEGGKIDEKLLEIIRQPIDYEAKPMQPENLVTRRYTDLNRKVAAAGVLGTPLALILTWGITSLLGVPIPPEVATAIGSVLATGVGYIVKEAKNQ